MNINPELIIAAMLSVPNEIPEWFEHEMLDKAPQCPMLIMTEDQKNEWGMEAEYLTDPALIKHYEDLSEYTFAKYKWENENKRQRYFQWRVYYAKNVLEFSGF